MIAEINEIVDKQWVTDRLPPGLLIVTVYSWSSLCCFILNSSVGPGFVLYLLISADERI